MKKVVIVFLILINSLACSNGQTKSSLDNTQNLSTEILGCWKLVDAYYEIKSNYPNLDSLSQENFKQNILSKKENSLISKFFEDNIIRSYSSEGILVDNNSSYEIKDDSLSVENINTLRKNTRSTSKISINNDTLYLEIDAFEEVDKTFGDIVMRDNMDLKILEDIKIETAKRYTKFLRVKDCDQYKKEDE